MDKHGRRSLAKLLAYCLARRPDEFGLVPGEEGFVPLKQLARALGEEPGWGFLREDHLREVAYDGPFELSEGRIRSREPQRLAGFFQEAQAPGQGEPPAILYAAVRRKAYPVILEHGLTAPEGSRVILAASREFALKVGLRRDTEPVMIEVRAAEAAEAGVSFQRAGELLYVAEAVPREFVFGPPLEKVPLPRRKPQAAPEPPPPVDLPGSFLLRPDHLPGAPPGKARTTGKRAEPEWKRERHNRRKDRGE
jgi:putative RNA 2'-phosphotransferase